MMSMIRSGRMPASSQASRELSTASLMAVSSAFWGLSNPRRWRFFVKNSETEISLCRAAMDWASSRFFGFGDRPGFRAGAAAFAAGRTAATGGASWNRLDWLDLARIVCFLPAIQKRSPSSVIVDRSSRAIVAGTCPQLPGVG